MLTRPYTHSDGTTHILFEPLDFIARLAITTRAALGRGVRKLRKILQTRLDGLPAKEAMLKRDIQSLVDKEGKMIGEALEPTP